MPERGTAVQAWVALKNYKKIKAWFEILPHINFVLWPPLFYIILWFWRLI